MYIAHNFGKVRIVHDGSPFTETYDIKVEWNKDGEWSLYRGFNSLSDDYALTNAKTAAGQAIKILAEEVATK